MRRPWRDAGHTALPAFTVANACLIAYYPSKLCCSCCELQATMLASAHTELYGSLSRPRYFPSALFYGCISNSKQLFFFWVAVCAVGGMVVKRPEGHGVNSWAFLWRVCMITSVLYPCYIPTSKHLDVDHKVCVAYMCTIPLFLKLERNSWIILSFSHDDPWHLTPNMTHAKIYVKCIKWRTNSFYKGSTTSICYLLIQCLVRAGWAVLA